ncbi:hypothetical protein JCM11491_002551 [Sporobolomyces phaffii]
MLRAVSFVLLGAAISINYYFSSRMPHSTSDSSPVGAPLVERTRFYLFGHPIAHSLSPTFHNAVFEALALENHSYALHEHAAYADDPDTMGLVHGRPYFGGAAVTMPHKVEALADMDRLGPEVAEIGSINTVVVLNDKLREGRNTDVLGIRNALLASLPSPAERDAERPWATASTRDASAVVIGGGGTTRAAIYALSRMHLSPIYLINRDPAETRAMIKAFPQYNLFALEDETDWTEQLAEQCQVVVGAIPSLAPETDGEKMVYRVAERVFELGGKATGRPRRFLDMAYKPHVTRLIAIAQKHNWLTIGGIEALVHQAFAQQKYWLLDPRAATYRPELADKLNDRVFEIAAEQVRRKAGVPGAVPETEPSPYHDAMRPTVGVRAGNRTRTHLFDVAPAAGARYGSTPVPAHSTSPAPSPSPPHDVTREDPYLRILAGSLRRCLLTQKVLPTDMMIPLKQLALPSRAGRPGLVLVPKGIQHARFEEKVGGKGSWVMCHHLALEQLALRGSYKRVNAQLSMPKNVAALRDWTATQLARRVGQEVEMYCERAKSWPKLDTKRGGERGTSGLGSEWTPIRRFRTVDEIDNSPETGEVEMVLDLGASEEGRVVEWRKRVRRDGAQETPVWKIGGFLRSAVVSPPSRSKPGPEPDTAAYEARIKSEDSTRNDNGVSPQDRDGLVGSIETHLDSTISLFERRRAREASGATLQTPNDQSGTATRADADERGEIYVFYSPRALEITRRHDVERSAEEERDAKTVARMRRDLVDLWISCWRIGLWTGQGWDE